MSLSRQHLGFAGAVVAGVGLSLLLTAPASALKPPEPGMLERMARAGTLSAAQAFAKSLGTYELKQPRRGAVLPAQDEQLTADAIAAQLGFALQGGLKTGSALQSELSTASLDLNHDQVVDERDVLALGLRAPKATASFPSLGTVKTFGLLIDFSNYPHYFDQAHIDDQLFGEGDGLNLYGSLHHYYDVSSYGQLNIDGETYGWHRASRSRDYYHPDDSEEHGESYSRQSELVKEAILAADANGADFSQYDNDGDGVVDYFLVIWSGPNGDWATFWWGYFGVALPPDFMVDGVRFSSYSWQAERWYGFGGEPPLLETWDPGVVVHETGHSLGLPDFYDYDGEVGPDGGVGGLDIMDGSGDHGCFNKYWLGWLTPTFTFRNLNDQLLRAPQTFQDAVLCIPGCDPVAPWAEYFMAQYRPNNGLDAYQPTSGLLLWHIDSRVNNWGSLLYNNSYSEHKLIKLVQADGLEEIENGAGANSGDYYQPANVFTPTSNPDSKRYDGSNTGIYVQDIQEVTDAMTADFILYSSPPPSVDITAPDPGDTVSNNVTISVSASDGGGIDHVDLFVDGELVRTSATANFNYTWNTRVDFNGPLTLLARAWDGEGQSGSASISVTVNNPGVTTFTELFTGGLTNWRVLHEPWQSRGQQTRWDSRTSPGDPPPPSSAEAWVRATASDEWFSCYELLRSQRLNTSAYTHHMQVRFMYRNRGGLELQFSADEGASWERLGEVPYSYEWRQFNRLFEVPPGHAYLRLVYTGDVREDDSAGLGANITNVLVREAPNGAPTVTITAPADGAVVSGPVTFSAEASSENNVVAVDWYVQDAPVHRDEDGWPWEYGRDTLWDDNHPAVKITAISEDSQGLPSLPSEIIVVWRNPRSFPVFNDLEGGADGWSLQNDGKLPQWTWTTGDSSSAVTSLALLGGWEAGNYDGLWYNGPPVVDGRRCIDLSGPLVTTPQLSFDYKAQPGDDDGLAVYLYTTWGGFQQVDWISGSVPEWTRKAISLENFIGQSGILVWWHFGGQAANGTGIYLDDVRVDNMPPRLDSLSGGNLIVGDTLSLVGTGFGSQRDASVVTLPGVVSLDPAAYTFWSNSRIDVILPGATVDGYVSVTVQDQTSNTLPLVLAPFGLSFGGLNSDSYYRPGDPTTLTVSCPAGTTSVDLLADGVVVDSSNIAPFNNLAFDFGSLRNGPHLASVRAHRNGATADSDPLPFKVFSLPGDCDLSGTLDAGDTAALRLLIPSSNLDFDFRPWADTTGDGRVREDDLSYIGYHFGESVL